MDALQLLQWTVAVSLLAASTLYDLKYRAVPGSLLAGLVASEASLLALRVWLYGLPPGWAWYAFMDAVLAAAVWLLAALCLLGLGDALAYTAIVLMHPWGWRLLPLPLTVLLYASASGATLALYNIIRNLVDPAARRELRRLPLRERLRLIATASLVEVEEVLAGSWWIPLLGNGVRRVTCSAEVEPKHVVREAIARGLVEPGGRVWATYGIPFLANILAGLLATIVLGDAPILSLLKR